jgi:hypothetical protein
MCWRRRTESAIRRARGLRRNARSDTATRIVMRRANRVTSASVRSIKLGRATRSALALSAVRQFGVARVLGVLAQRLDSQPQQRLQRTASNDVGFAR